MRDSVLETLGDPGNLVVRYLPVNVDDIRSKARGGCGIPRPEGRPLIVSLCRLSTEKQVGKLVDVRDIHELKPDESVFRELAMIKVRANADQRENVIALTNIFRGSIIDVSNESLMIEITGNSGKIDAFLKLVSGYEILELARTGVAGLGRGTKNVIYLDKLV